MEPDPTSNAAGSSPGTGTAGVPVGAPATDEQFEQLAPAVVKAWRIGLMIATVFVVGAAVLAELFWLRYRVTWLPSGLISAVLLAWLGFLTFWHPAASYRRWRFAVRPWDLLAEHGVIWRTRVCIPRLRLQHVDIESGPVDRWFGLCQLKVFTAGASEEVLTIHGLTPDRAEQLREQLLEGHIGSLPERDADESDEKPEAAHQPADPRLDEPDGPTDG